MRYFALFILFTFFNCANKPTDSGPRKIVSEYIKVTSPTPFQEVAGTLLIEGEAKGAYFFEGDFPIEIVLENKDVLQYFASAQGEWMTEDFVPFSAEIPISNLAPQEIKLKLIRANPSGDPRENMVLEMPLVVK